MDLSDYGAEIENQLCKIVSSGARMDGLLNISFDEYTSVSVLLPGTEEQDRIADFFRHLDNLITLHQCEFHIVSKRRKARLRRRAFKFTVIFVLIVLSSYLSLHKYGFYLQEQVFPVFHSALSF